MPVVFLFQIELPWPKNPANTACNIRNHWTAVSTLLGLISSVYRESPPLEIETVATECRAETQTLNHRSTSHISVANFFFFCFYLFIYLFIIGITGGVWNTLVNQKRFLYIIWLTQVSLLRQEKQPKCTWSIIITVKHILQGCKLSSSSSSVASISTDIPNTLSRHFSLSFIASG